MSNPRIAEVFANMSKFYSLWNSFRFSESLEISDTLFNQALKFSSQISPKFNFDLSQLREQINTIKELSQGNKNYLLLNFYFTAERYERNYQHDIAALLYYRTLESIFGTILGDCADGFNTSQPNYSLFKMENQELLIKFTEAHKQAYESSSEQERLPDKLAMFDAFCLVKALKHPLSEQLKAGRIAHIAQVRNNSIYAHGSGPLTEKSITDMRKLASETLEIYLTIKKLNSISIERKKFEFIKLNTKFDATKDNTHE